MTMRVQLRLKNWIAIKKAAHWNATFLHILAKSRDLLRLLILRIPKTWLELSNHYHTCFNPHFLIDPFLRMPFLHLAFIFTNGLANYYRFIKIQFHSHTQIWSIFISNYRIPSTLQTSINLANCWFLNTTKYDIFHYFNIEFNL